MKPAIVLYPHGAGGRFVGVIIESLHHQTDLVRANSGHGNHSVRYFNPDISDLEKNPYSIDQVATGISQEHITWFRQNWHAAQSIIPTPVMHANLIDPNVVLEAVEDLVVVIIQAQPEDSWQLAWNWMIKNDDRNTVMSSNANVLEHVIRWHSDENLDINKIKSAGGDDLVLWSCLRALIWPIMIKHFNNITWSAAHDPRVCKITWQEVKTGAIKDRLQELADKLGLELTVERRENAQQIIDKWVGNQTPPPCEFDLSPYRIPRPIVKWSERRRHRSDKSGI